MTKTPEKTAKHDDTKKMHVKIQMDNKKMYDQK